MISGHQNGKNSIFGIFGQFLVVFGVPPLRQNLSGWVRLNLQFLDWIWLFTYKTIFWSHKIAMLNGKSHLKLKNQIFGKKNPAKNVVFWFWPKIQKLRPLYYTKKIWKFRIWSQIRNTLPDGAIRTTKWHFFGTFWPKMAVFATGGSSKPLFSTDFQWMGAATGLAGVLSFWPFLVIFGHFFPFLQFQLNTIN